MTYKDANYWHIKDKFLKEKPRDLLANIVLHDGRNARNIPLKAQRDLKDLDEALAFLLNCYRYSTNRGNPGKKTSKRKLR